MKKRKLRLITLGIVMSITLFSCSDKREKIASLLTDDGTKFWILQKYKNWNRSLKMSNVELLKFSSNGELEVYTYRNNEFTPETYLDLIPSKRWYLASSNELVLNDIEKFTIIDISEKSLVLYDSVKMRRKFFIWNKR